jgi:PAS domain S-box-containing protein
MSWVTIIWPMIASACLTLAAMHLLVWGLKRTAWASLLFAVTAVGTAAVAACELWLMRAETAREFGAVLRWSHVPYWVVVLALVAFVRLYLRAGRPWLAWTICGMRTVSLLLNFLGGENLNYRTITGLRHVPFLGDSVAIADGVPNPWMLVGQASLVLFVIFAADATLAVWRQGDRRPSVWLAGAIVFFITGSIGEAVLTFWGFIYQPITPSLFFLGIVAVMAYDMSHETLRAATLAVDLGKREEWLDLAADSAGVGLWLWEFQTNCLWITEKTRALYGFSSHGQVPLDAFLSTLHPDDRERVAQAAQRCARDGADFRDDYRIVLPDGSLRWMRVLAKAFVGPFGKPERMTGVSFDITERKQAEQKIAEQSAELGHVARVAAMSQLTSSLAHELNQPLGAILRNAEAGELFLQAPAPDLDEVRALLADIRTDDQRAGAVIDRMRSLLKRRPAEDNALDLSLLAAEVLALVRPEADARKIRMALTPGPALPPVRGDRVQLQQVLLNLLLNAMDAMADAASDGRRITVGIQAAGAQVEVAVSDTGPGIPADTLARIFEPFFTTKPSGLGMGLAISRSILEAHGGSLRATNNATGGTTFTFALPAGDGVEEGRGERDGVRGKKWCDEPTIA